MLESTQVTVEKSQTIADKAHSGPLGGEQFGSGQVLKAHLKTS